MTMQSTFTVYNQSLEVSVNGTPGQLVRQTVVPASVLVNVNVTAQNLIREVLHVKVPILKKKVVIHKFVCSCLLVFMAHGVDGVAARNHVTGDYAIEPGCVSVEAPALGQTFKLMSVQLITAQ